MMLIMLLMSILWLNVSERVNEWMCVCVWESYGVCVLIGVLSGQCPHMALGAVSLLFTLVFSISILLMPLINVQKCF